MMKLQLVLATTVVLIAVAVSTVLQGQATERWPFAPARTKTLEEFSRRLKAEDAIPVTIGPWTSQDTPVDPKEFKASNCDAAIARQYVNSVTNEVVDVYLVSGVARHVTIHTPDKCYPGAGFVMQGEPQQARAGGDEHQEFMTAAFRKEDMAGTHSLRIFWSFTEDGSWEGPRKPKPRYAGRPALYKLYLIEPTEELELDETKSAALKFAELFLPLVTDDLFPEAEPPAPAEEGTKASTARQTPAAAHPMAG